MSAKSDEKLLHPSEIAQNEANTQVLLAQARKENALAQEAEHKASTARLMAEREAEKRARELCDFDHGHIYIFDSAVRSESVTKCIKELRYWSVLDPGCDIEIMFDSPGGSVFDGMNLYDFIQELRRAGHHITTSTRGMAASMGSILLQAGDHRVMGAEAWILIHEISTMTGGKIGDIEDEMELLKKMEKRALKIFASRSNLTEHQIAARQKRKDWWIDSTEAFKLGLVDEVR